ncbi:MAG: glycosyltransferase [Prevotella sp.]|nr:glycosyltransferase [Prevotella sp.]
MQNNECGTQTGTDKPLISFIVACYNIPTTMLEECIDSIVGLSIGDDEREIIVVDDGSDVPVSNILGNYRDKIFVIRKDNGGLSDARNCGLKAAHGKFIQFVDSDDYLLKEGYETCIDFLRANNPDMLMFNFTSGTGCGSKTAKSKMMSGTHYLMHYNMKAAACCYIFRKDILGGLRFHKGILHEDEEFTPQLILRAKKLMLTEITAYYYRIRENSITTSTDSKTIGKRINDIVSVIEKLKVLCSNLTGNERTAMERRVAQLSMDAVYNCMTDSTDYREACSRTDMMTKKNILPLPVRTYTMKYILFSMATHCAAGHRMMYELCRLNNRKHKR